MTEPTPAQCPATAERFSPLQFNKADVQSRTNTHAKNIVTLFEEMLVVRHSQWNRSWTDVAKLGE
jgi:hypothetical protein